MYERHAGVERPARLAVDVVSDIVCPWCFIGKRKLESAIAELARREPSVDVQVRWHPFQLNPDLPAAGVPRATYLAQKFGKGLWPSSLADQGRVYQWSFWAMTEVEKPALTILMDTFGMKKDPEGAEAGKKSLEKPFDILDQHLAGRDYVLGKDFTIVDINLASVIGWAKAGKVDLSRWANLSAWLDRCQGRPAASAARKG